jgi:tRNA C32,U32 (ribose-2'-O)-methylase TrmJ
MFDAVQEFLRHIGFLREQDRVRMMLVIRQMLYRARYSEREVRIIRGVLRQAYWRMAHPKASPDESPAPEEDFLEGIEE